MTRLQGLLLSALIVSLAHSAQAQEAPPVDDPDAPAPASPPADPPAAPLAQPAAPPTSAALAPDPASVSDGAGADLTGPAPVIVEYRLPERFYKRNGDLKRKVEPVPGMTMPPMYEAGTKAVAPLWITGTATAAAAYGVTAFAAIYAYSWSDFCFGQCEANDAYLWGAVPVVGGFIGAAQDDVTPTVKGIFVVGSILQVAGLSTLIAGVATRKPVWVLKDGPVRFDVGAGNANVSGSF